MEILAMLYGKAAFLQQMRNSALSQNSMQKILQSRNPGETEICILSRGDILSRGGLYTP